ncbi:ribokinase [Paenibacillus glycanilyticus]|uniref:Ribokinase n=1 Tax=Paenibacillus glycanilyticus TaxID=126569 RepID=A0ABQ6GI91_9BACL|nr:ribokinase [Paenibacillus glycanilyticus]GLX70407.1 ribokinase [Paenibacillus glycanilyticus]
MSARAGKIVVVGSLNMDIVVKTSRFPERGETLSGQEVHFHPGGKGANQAVACARQGHETVMLGAIGEDAFGSSLAESLESSGVDTRYLLTKPGVATGIASITLAEQDNSIVVVPGANGALTPDDVMAWQPVISEAAIMLIQFEIPMEVVSAAVHAAHKAGVKVILNPAPACEIPEDLVKKVTYITPNQSELHAITGIDPSADGLESAMDALLARGPEFVVATLGSRGAAWKERGGSLRRAATHHVDVVDTTGAGDAFNGGLACSLAINREIGDNVKHGIAVSALAVTKFGAQDGMPTLQEVELFKSVHENEGSCHDSNKNDH